MTAMDDLTVLLGHMPDAELEARKRLRTCHRAATFNLANTESEHARKLFWMVAETASAFQFAPADQAFLDRLIEYLRGLLISARRVQQLEGLL